MSILNSVVSAVFGVVLRPLQLVSPLVGIFLVSLATAIGMLLVIRASSDQKRIQAAKNGMYAAMLEMRLYNDDLRAILRAQVALLVSNAAYLRASLVPALWLIVPIGLLMAQLDAFYGHTGVAPGQSVLVTAVLRQDADASRDPAASLATPPGTRVAIPVIWFPAAREVVWSLSPQAAGELDLRVRVGAEDIVKTLQVSDLVVRTSPVRPAPGFFNQLRYPVERPLPADSALQAISIAYPARLIDVFGRQIHWSVLYLALSVVFALMLKRAFRVTF